MWFYMLYIFLYILKSVEIKVDQKKGEKNIFFNKNKIECQTDTNNTKGT